MDHSEVKRMDDLDLELEEEEEEGYVDPETYLKQSNAKVVTEEELRKLMEEYIHKISETYLISEIEVPSLLQHFLWIRTDFDDKWFDDAKSVRETVGLLDRPLDDDIPSTDTEFFCGVCFKTHPLESSASVSCGHRICIFCWPEHINNIINNISADQWKMWLKCPYVPCQASVCRDMIERFASKEEKSKYDRFLLKSYVEGSKTMKLCPRASTGRSCEIDPTPNPENSDVYCICFLKFCWNCSKDVHTPVDCKTAAKWLAINSSDYKNPDWILAHTVPCPKCKRRVEENNFFSLKMECLPPCNFEFCWRCLGPWTQHGEEHCDFKNVSYEEVNQQLEMANFVAARFRNCYKNSMTNESFMQKAKAKLSQLDIDIEDLSNSQLPTKPQIKIILEPAWLQVMECRRVLKWTYAYGYYLREDEVQKHAFLDFKQREAKELLEKLCSCIVNELLTFLYEKKLSENFAKFTIKLTELTRTTRHHYECLVREIEDGLSNVFPASASQIVSNEDASCSERNQEDD